MLLKIGVMHLISAGCFTLQHFCFSLCCMHNKLQGKKHSVDESAESTGAAEGQEAGGGGDGEKLCGAFKSNLSMREEKCDVCTGKLNSSYGRGLIIEILYS